MNEIFIERQNKLLRIAIKENKKLKECFIEEESDTPYPGQIYKGIVKNIVPAIKCAFIDIGTKKNAYMYLDQKFHNTRLKKGEELLVEVIKEDLSEKGAKVTSAISIPGRHIVLETLNHEIGFSKKISNPNFVQEVKENLEKPEEIGAMIRTHGEKVPVERLNRELKELYEIYKSIELAGRTALKPKLLYDDNNCLQRTLRDFVDEQTIEIHVNNEKDQILVQEFLRKNVDVQEQIRVIFEVENLFDFSGIEKEILSLRNSKVMLPCGGSLIMDKTEAMYVIDVNSGKNVKQSSVDKTAYETNMEAAEEIGRQIRLRNFSGIIIVDFIDMDNLQNQQKVLQRLKSSFEGDKNKTVIYPFTELNLVQIARRRRGKSIYEFIEEPCENCKGKGKRIRLSYLCLLIKNRIHRMNQEQDIQDIYIEIGSSYEKEIKEDILGFVKEIDGLNKKIYMDFVKNIDLFKLEPLIFANQKRNLQVLKIYG